MTYLKATFYVNGKAQERRSFYVSKDETLFYRTIMEARNYGEEKGYEKFRLDGEIYWVKGIDARTGRRSK